MVGRIGKDLDSEYVVLLELSFLGWLEPVGVGSSWLGWCWSEYDIISFYYLFIYLIFLWIYYLRKIHQWCLDKLYQVLSYDKVYQKGLMLNI